MSGPIALSEINPSEAVEVLNPDGQGGFVLICEHASNRIPAALNRLGLSDEALSSHIAWDPCRGTWMPRWWLPACPV